ncbi:hypothetical protein ACOMHN_038969 [Nucella lapillus]
MPNLKVEKWDPAKDGILNEESLTRKLKKQGYNYTKYTFSPGVNFPDHTHSVSKKDAILMGKFEFGMYGQTVILEPGDMVEVPQNAVHNAKVVGNENVVFFDSTK